MKFLAVTAELRSFTVLIPVDRITAIEERDSGCLIHVDERLRIYSWMVKEDLQTIVTRLRELQ